MDKTGICPACRGGANCNSYPMTPSTLSLFGKSCAARLRRANQLPISQNVPDNLLVRFGEYDIEAVSLPGAPIQNAISQQTEISCQLRLRKLRNFSVDKHDVVLIEPTEVPKAIEQRDLPVSARHDSLTADTAHPRRRHDILGVVTIRLLGQQSGASNRLIHFIISE